jgi:hypothetical protein
MLSDLPGFTDKIGSIIERALIGSGIAFVYRFADQLGGIPFLVES